MTLLQRKGIDLRQCFLHLQADNCSRELKNNTMLRLAASMVALHRLKGKHFLALYSSNAHVKGIGGLHRDDLDDRFWRRRAAPHSPSDVVLRTKQFMSDENWQPMKFLYMPAQAAAEMAAAQCPPGERLFLHVF
ncbi:unnamed protein product [Effrenium voratum]|uniref:Uncharacterized protein n=1 Tax=Effrenium voratum TaxID=2562239 RepID=A0AA36IGK3_9DINO|nr:unnamed protein product [Effrenium voratum]